ncbi:MAG: EMC3/TMCO1 family protein [Promethearchaeota archaeon]
MSLLMVLQDSGWMNSPPGSMWFILLLSLIISIISVVLTKLLIDTKEMERKQKQIKAHNEEKKKIIEIAKVDVDRYHKARKKWERRDIMLKKTQQGMAMDRMKPTLLFFLPMIIIFWVLRNIYGNSPVAATPMNPLVYGLLQWPIGMGMADESLWINNAAWINFTAWYFLCSLGTNTLLQRILGLQSQASGGMEQMFTGQQTAAAQFPDI